MGGAPGSLAAFAAGMLSFVSPCVLPLVPAYLSFMTGAALSGRSGRTRAGAVLWPALLFVVGFTAVFVALGASASLLGSVLVRYRQPLMIASGVLIVCFGAVLLGVPVPWARGEARFDLAASRRFGRASSLVLGAAFAFGWTPCVGPILASILLLAGSTRNVANGVTLLGAYSLGLAVPFLAVALLFGRLTTAIGWFQRHAMLLQKIAGAVLVVLGVAVATGTLGVFAAAVGRWVPIGRIG